MEDPHCGGGGGGDGGIRQVCEVNVGSGGVVALSPSPSLSLSLSLLLSLSLPPWTPPVSQESGEEIGRCVQVTADSPEAEESHEQRFCVA